MAVPLDFLPRDLRKALLKFQKDGIRFGIEKQGRCLIGDEMGLGKTLQALSIAFYYKEQWPLLIVVPASMRLPWVDEIEKWLPEIQPEEINLVKNSADISAMSTAKISIISYGLISFGSSNFGTSLMNSLENADFGVAILDESHMVKNRQSTRTKRIDRLLKNIKRVLLLTGTPTLARPEELYSQINMIRPGLVGDWTAYGQRYCDGRYILQPVKGGRAIHKFDTRGASNLQELHDVLKSNLMIRRLKKDVLTQLPAKRRQKIRFEITADSKNKKELDKSLDEFKTVVSNLKNQFSAHTKDKLTTMNDVNGAITRLFMATGLAKAGAIQQYIENLLDGMENKFIVFCFHLAVIDAVTEVLAKRHVKHVRLAGDVPPDIRASYVREFQSDPKCRVAVLSITASCMGLTLTAADHVVFAELHWTPGVMQQAEDRCHRIGQQNAVQIHYLIAKGTFDDVLWSMLSRKLTVTSEALDGKTRVLVADEANRDEADLLSLCKAWIPDDDDDDDCDAYLFTPKTSKQAKSNQRDIRSSFALSSREKPARKKRKTSKYYADGMINISDSSDDNGEFKVEFKSKKRKKLGDGVKELEDIQTATHGLTAIEESSKCLIKSSEIMNGNNQEFDQCTERFNGSNSQENSAALPHGSSSACSRSPIVESASSMRQKCNNVDKIMESAGKSAEDSGSKVYQKKVNQDRIKQSQISALGSKRSLKTDRENSPGYKIQIKSSKSNSSKNKTMPSHGQLKVNTVKCSDSSKLNEKKVNQDRLSIKDQISAVRSRRSQTTDRENSPGSKIQIKSSKSSSIRNKTKTTHSQLEVDTEKCSDSKQDTASYCNVDGVYKSLSPSAPSLSAGLSKDLGLRSGVVAVSSTNITPELRSSTRELITTSNHIDTAKLTVDAANDSKNCRLNAAQMCLSNKPQDPAIFNLGNAGLLDFECVENSATTQKDVYQCGSYSAVTDSHTISSPLCLSGNLKAAISDTSCHLEVGDVSEAGLAWSCLSCTFLNHADLEFCEICETKRPNMFTRIKERNRSREKEHVCECEKGLKDTKKTVVKFPLKTCKLGEFATKCCVSGNKDEKENVTECRPKEDKSRIFLGTRQRCEDEVSKNISTPKIINKQLEIKKVLTFKSSNTGIDSVLETRLQDAGRKEISRCGSKNATKELSSGQKGSEKRLLNESSSIGYEMKSRNIEYNDNGGLASQSSNSQKNAEINAIVESDSTITDSDENDSVMQHSSVLKKNSDFEQLAASDPDESNSIDKQCPNTLQQVINGPSKMVDLPGKLASNEDRITRSSTMVGRRGSKSSGDLLEISRMSEAEMSDCSLDLFEVQEEGCLEESNDCSSQTGSPRSLDNKACGFKLASQLFAEKQQTKTEIASSSSKIGLKDSSDESSSKRIARENSNSPNGFSPSNHSQSPLSRRNSPVQRSLSPSSFQDNLPEPSEKSEKDLEDLFPEDDDMLCEDFDDDISVISSEKSEYDSDEEEEPDAIDLKYKLSFESDRVYLYDEEENALNVNFQIPQMACFDLEELPSVFKHPYNLKQLKRFGKEWRSFTVTKQRMIRKAGKIFKSPIHVYEELKEMRYNPSKERFTSKQKRNEKVMTIADMIGGKVTELAQTSSKKNAIIHKTASNDGPKDKNVSEKDKVSSTTKLLQAIDSDGNALCLFCNDPVKNGFKPGSVETRFCSSNCKDEYQFRCSDNGRVVRERLFELQKGVCQLCQLDTYEIFRRIKALKKKDRRADLETTHYISLPANVLNKIILTPKEGLFWEADHIHAVSEGGGECGLENYRTLCIPCHREVTKDLMKRLRSKRKIDHSKAEGNSDIVGYFNTAARGKVKEKGRAKKERKNIGVQSKSEDMSKAHSSANNPTVIIHDVKEADDYIASLIAKSAENNAKGKKFKPRTTGKAGL